MKRIGRPRTMGRGLPHIKTLFRRPQTAIPHTEAV